MKFLLLKCTLWCTVWPLHVCAVEPSSWQLRPAAMATGVAIDTPLSITFSVAPRLGRDGAVKIFRAADHVLVDELHPGEALDSIGPARQEYHRLVRYTAFKMDGAMLTIRPHNARLDYDTEYLSQRAPDHTQATPRYISRQQVFNSFNHGNGWDPMR